MLENLMQDTPDFTTKDRSSLPARSILWLAFGLLFVSQFFGTILNQPYRAWLFKDWWFLVVLIGEMIQKGRYDWEPFLALAVGTFSFTVLVAAPWMVGLLNRIPPWLWLLRVLMAGAVVWMSWTIWETIEFFDAIEEPLPFQTGFWLFFVSVAVNAFGLWLIPRNRAEVRPGVA